MTTVLVVKIHIKSKIDKIRAGQVDFLPTYRMSNMSYYILHFISIAYIYKPKHSQIASHPQVSSYLSF